MLSTRMTVSKMLSPTSPAANVRVSVVPANAVTSTDWVRQPVM